MLQTVLSQHHQVSLDWSVCIWTLTQVNCDVWPICITKVGKHTLSANQLTKYAKRLKRYVTDSAEPTLSGEYWLVRWYYTPTLKLASFLWINKFVILHFCWKMYGVKAIAYQGEDYRVVGCGERHQRSSPSA